MTETPEPSERRHTEEPAEGADASADEATSADRTHTEEPSEGAAGKGDPDGGPSREAGDSGSEQRP